MFELVDTYARRDDPPASGYPEYDAYTGVTHAVSASRIAFGINVERRRRNRAIRAACKAFVFYAPVTVMHVQREYHRGRVIRVEPRADVLAHADLMRAVTRGRLTPAEERCFRRVMLACDSTGAWIVRPDDAGRMLVRPLTMAECAEEYDLPEATVRRYIARAFAKIRAALYGDDATGAAD